MTYRPGWRSLLVVLLAVAALVELVHAVGWWRWRNLAATLEADPATAATELAARRPWLPGAVAASRRLPGEALDGAGAAAAAAAWERLGVLQRRWFPTDPEGAESGARAAALRGDAAAALRWTREAIRRDPTDPYQHRAGALLELAGGRYDAALEHLAQGEALAPGSTRSVGVLPGDDVWVRLEGLRRRLDLYPRDEVATRLALAASLVGLGRDAEAVAALEPVSRHPEVRLYRAARALGAGDTATVDSLARPLAEARRLPRSVRARALSLIAQAQQAQGQTSAAAATAHRALALAPGSPAPYLALARVAAAQGDEAAALEHLRRAWGLAPGDVAVIMTFARAAQRAGRDDDARLALERAAAVAPDRPEVAAALIEHLLDRGQRLEAALRLAEALERFPADRRLLALLERARVQPRPPG